MMPKNKLRYQRMTRLRMYPTAQHTHEAQMRASEGSGQGKGFKAVPHSDAPRQPPQGRPWLAASRNRR